MTYRVALYGRLRDAGLGDEVTLTTPKSLTAKELLRELAKYIGVDGCVLATKDRVLAPTERAPRSLSVLPPVCGG